MAQRPDKLKILIIGDAVAPTGFSRVIRSIFRELQADYELHQLATRYDGGEHDYPWKLYKASSGRSVYGYDQIPALVEQIQPAIVFLLYDIRFRSLTWKCFAQPRLVQESFCTRQLSRGRLHRK